MKLKKLLLAGSHAATPAYAVAQEIKKRKLSWKIHFIGKKWGMEGENLETLEYEELPKLGVKFHPLESGKIQTKFTRYTIPALFKIPFGFIKSLVYLLKIKPDLTLSFGGASGALTSFWSFVLSIPVIIHEQTASAGRANIFSARFARKIMISRESSKQFFPASKIVLTGNPLNPELSLVLPHTSYVIPHTILVTGGSRGSTRINAALEKILPSLKKKYEVIHLNGKNRLSFSEMAETLLRTDIVVGRAGANTVSEIIALKKPSILTPIPWSYKDEQTKNAEFARNFGIARILLQAELTPERLEREIENLVKDYPNILKRVKNKVSPDLDASKKVVDILEKI